MHLPHRGQYDYLFSSPPSLTVMEFPVQLIFPLLTSLRPFHIHPVLGKRLWRVAWDTPIREPPALGGGWIYSGHRLCDLDKGIECGPVKLSRNTKFGWPAEFYQKIMQNTVEQLGKKKLACRKRQLDEIQEDSMAMEF